MKALKTTFLSESVVYVAMSAFQNMLVRNTFTSRET